MGFGASYALVYVDCINWVHTERWKRVVRTILGALISSAIYIGLKYIPVSDTPTRVFLHYVLPYLSISFFIYGIFPILCLKMKLVSDEDLGSSISVERGKILY